MKYAIVGKRNRKVYEVTEGDVKMVFTLVNGEPVPYLHANGEPEITEEIQPPQCSSHKEVIEISDAEAGKIASTEDVPFARWYIVDGELTDTKPN